jgi:tetratricopeptide (TPR) repeat protein
MIGLVFRVRCFAGSLALCSLLALIGAGCSSARSASQAQVHAGSDHHAGSGAPDAAAENSPPSAVGSEPKLSRAAAPAPFSASLTSPPAGPEVVGPHGREYWARRPGEDARQEDLLAQARANLAAQPDDVDCAIWVGRRLGYLWRMREAIAAYTQAIDRHPRYAALYRHRGHRFISIRRFGDAETDLERAARLIRGQRDAIEPDGMPNVRNIPLTTTAFNVWYHLGLARYLQGDFEGAHDAFVETLKHAYRHDDNRVAATYWLYLTLRQLERHEAAQARLDVITPDMEIIENFAYHDLLMLFKGLRSVEAVREKHVSGADAATAGYGVGMWRRFNGRPGEARLAFEQVVSSDDWPAFGFIAAEVELSRASSARPE